MTASIRVIDEFGTEIDRHTFPADMSFAEAAMGHWPDGWEGRTVFIMSPDWEPVGSTSACSIPMGDKEWTIALRPQAFMAATAFMIGGATGVAVTWFQIAITAVALLGSFLFKPEMPQVNSNTYNWEDDDAQYLSAQSNKLRPGSRVPDVFGIMRVWPDLIAEPRTYYSGDSQTIEELYVVSNGYADITEARFHDEAIDTIPASTITVYHPGNGATWPADFEVFRTNTFVGGTELPGPNEDSALLTVFTLSTDGTITANTPGFFTEFQTQLGNIFRFTDDLGVLDPLNNIFYTVVSVGGPDDTVMTVSPAPAVDQVDLGGLNFRGAKLAVGPFDVTGWNRLYLHAGREAIPMSEYVANGVGMIAPPTNPISGSFVSLDNNSERGSVTYQFWSNSTVSEWNGGFAPSRGWGYGVTTSPNWSGTNVYFVQWSSNSGYNPEVPGSGLSTSVFQVPGTAVDQIEYDVEFVNGLYAQNAGQPPAPRTVAVSIFYRLVGTTDWTEQSDSFTAKTRTPRRFTIQVPVPQGQYEVYMQRTTDSINDTGSYVAVDALRLISLRGRQVMPDEVTTDELTCTLVKLSLSTQNGEQVTDQRQFNCVASRSLPNRRTTGTAGEMTPTNLVVDAMLYTLIDDAGYDPNQIDVAGLEAIEADLRAIVNNYDQYNAIHDQTQTPEDQVSSMGNLVRIIVYRRGSQIYFNRLKGGMAPRYLFNARNKTGPEKRTIQFGDANKPTSVILRYLDATDGWSERSVQWPDPATEPGADLGPEEQTVLGVTDPDVSQRIAQFIWDKKTYERDVIEVPVTEEGMQVAPGDVIAVTDALTVEQPIDGEILGVSGTIYQFDRPIMPALESNPNAGQEMRCILRDRLGSIIGDGVIDFPPDTFGLYDMVAIWPADPEMPNDGDQTGLLYSFIPVTDEGAALWQVTNVDPSREGPVTLSGVRYRDEIYQSDDAVLNVIPAKKKRMR